MGEDENPFTDEDLQLDVPHDKEEDIRIMLWNDELMWSVHLGKINMTEMWIDLVTDAKPFISPPYRADPKTT